MFLQLSRSPPARSGVATLRSKVAGSQSGKSSQKEPISWDFEIPAPEKKVTPPQIVDEAARKVVSGIPLRLIDLNTGTFSSTGDLLRAFNRSPERQALLSDASLAPADLAEKADGVTRKYFAYIMLSHVWGEDEPLYRDIVEIANVLEMSPSSTGTRKLQNFCRIAKRMGFGWCWSDTCCIDKSSSAELQESINSMFKWYRNSTLTLAFLLDVLEPTLEALKGSRWFTRGWILQELLAPKAIVFYMGDWTPFIPPSSGDLTLPNYKLVPEFVQSLENILGIDKSYLVGFTPGLEHVRERLRWMATRQTTKIEDMAYCLLGILDLHLPILYGEGERSFVRLQEEIMKNTDDISIFDWVGKPSDLNSYLAWSPSCFRQITWRPSQTTADNSTSLDVSDVKRTASAVLVHVAECLRNEPPPGHFIANGKMNLRTFVYPVVSVELTASKEIHKRWFYRYHIKAQGLEPLTVVTAYKVPDDASSLFVGRIWDSGLLEAPTEKTNEPTADELAKDTASDVRNLLSKNVANTSELAKRLEEPFVAQLLVAHPNGRFHRVHTELRIVAQPCSSDYFDLNTPGTLIVH